MKRTLGQLIRYGVVGLTSNGIGFLLYLLLTWLGMGPKVAMSLLYVIGVVQTFFFNKHWSFSYGGKDRGAFIRYCQAYGLGYLINLAALVVLVDKLGYPHQIVQCALILLVAGMLFLLQKFWVFPAAAN